MLLDRGHGNAVAEFLEVRRDEGRADVGELERLAFAPGKEAIDGQPVGGAGVVVGDARREEVEEMPGGLLAGIEDEGRDGQGAGHCRSVGRDGNEIAVHGVTVFGICRVGRGVSEPDLAGGDKEDIITSFMICSLQPVKEKVNFRW